MKKGKEYTIGLLVSGIMDTFTVSVCQGVIKATQEVGINLIIFPGKYLDREFIERKENFYEYQYNTVFSYAQKETLDALLVSANTIGCFTTTEKIQQMLSQYTGIPCVLIASKIEGYVSVTFDNNSGIKDVINYLIHKLNCTKIGMIGGPANNTDAYERQLAFRQALEDNGIPLPAKRYTEGDLSRYPLSTFRNFIEQNPDLEAVFCVNDDTAIGLYDVLKEKNIAPGKDLFVFGYDNIPYAATMKPALSSIWANPIQLAGNAVHAVLQILEGEDVPSQILSTRFIKRDSLGADEENDKKTANKQLDEAYINTIFDDIFYRYHGGNNKDEYNYIRTFFKQLMEHLILNYKCTEPDTKTLQNALHLGEILFNQKVLDYMDVEKFIEHVENMNTLTNDTHTDISSAIYRKIILAMKQQYGEIFNLQEEEKISLMVFARDIMSFETGNDQSYTVLLEHLDWLHIKNAYIYTYEKPMLHLPGEKFILPEKLYLKAMLKEGIVQSVPASVQEVSSTEIYTNLHINKTNLPQVLFPLYSDETLYGVFLCDMTEKLFDYGDFLVNQLSSAIKVINLLKNNDIIQQQLENSLATLKENNIALDTLSKYDVLTGILNRRGFFDAAEKFLLNSRESGINTLVAYIDMNNLKIVNDRYGHDEGDFSIKKIGELLTEITAEPGIVGRIGGDEFALIMPYEKEYDIVSQIYAKFHAFNQESSKLYNITVSVGGYVIYADNPVTLSDALTHADEMLYIEKKHREKNVAK